MKYIYNIQIIYETFKNCIHNFARTCVNTKSKQSKVSHCFQVKYKFLFRPYLRSFEPLSLTVSCRSEVCGIYERRTTLIKR